MLGAAQVLALTMCYEAANQGRDGLMGVASTIWNRSEHKSALELAMICVENKQFSCWNSHWPDMSDIVYWQKDAPSIAVYEQAKEIAVSMIYGTFRPTIDATHYHRYDAQPAWSNSMVRVTQIKDHVFFKEG